MFSLAEITSLLNISHIKIEDVNNIGACLLHCSIFNIMLFGQLKILNYPCI